MATVQDGKRYNLTLRHGTTERKLDRAKVRKFQDEFGVDRYEAITRDATIGFLLDNVIKADPL